jgi:hypothetical protein
LLRLEKFRERPCFEAQLEAPDEALPSAVLDHGGGVQKPARIALRQHERRATLAREHVGNDQGSGAMISLKEKLRLRKQMNIDARRAPPNVLAEVEGRAGSANSDSEISGFSA